MQGIEFDPVGKRRAYRLHAEHLGDAYGTLQNGLQSRPVPATEIAHVCGEQRTQARGVPWGAPVIRSLRDLDDYEVAELVRKKTEACVTAIVFGDDEAQQGIAPSVVDADGNRVEQFCRADRLCAWWQGHPLQPRHRRRGLRRIRATACTISAGSRVPYELLTGDLSQVNYSSIRAGLVEFRRMIDAVQWQLFIRCSARRSGAGSRKRHGLRQDPVGCPGRMATAEARRRSIRRRMRWRTCCRSAPAP